MGFLEKIWDETVAGPPPESGLGKLRKYNSYSGPRLTVDDPPFQITRSITIVLSNYVQIPNVNVSGGSIPSSPSLPTTPQSPSSPGGNLKRLTRRKSTPAALPQGEPRSPSAYTDIMIVLSALDR